MSQTDLTFKVARIHRLAGEGTMKAFVDLSINDTIVIRGLKIIQGKNGVFVSMPQEKGKDNKWYDTIRCLSEDLRGVIQAKVIAAYNGEQE